MPRDQLRIELGSVVQANYLRELGAAGPRVLRGAIGINTPAPPTVPGAQALAEFTQPVSLDAWRTVLAAAATGVGVGGPDAGYLPRQITLRARELTVSGRRFTAAQVELQRTDDAWRAKLQSDQIAGTAEYREPRSAAAAGQVQARLSRLHLAAEPPSTAPRAEPTIDVAPSSVPAMDVVVEDFEWRGRKLGRVEIEAVNRTAPGTSQREWRLQRLLMRMPEATLTANGQWAAVPGASGAASRRMTAQPATRPGGKRRLHRAPGLRQDAARWQGQAGGRAGVVGFAAVARRAESRRATHVGAGGRASS